MPTTINGIGTTYIGRKELEKIPGVCEKCNRESQLENYVTRLWFTVLFVPLIPLGKKMILNHCRYCTRHKVLPLAEWEALKANAIEQEQSAVAANPDDPNCAIELLGTLMAFRRLEEASAQAEAMLQKFPENATIQLNVGSCFESLDRPEQAKACFLRAYELAPADLAVKHAAAVVKLNAGDPAAAQRILQESPALSPADDPGIFLYLANAYQQQDNHEAALAVYRDVLQAHPTLGRDKALRKLVRNSEQASFQQESILPPISLFRSPMIWVPAAVVAIVAVFLGWNYYLSQHQTLFVANGFAAPMTVQLDDTTSVVVPPHSSTAVTIAEGPHRATYELVPGEKRTDEFLVQSSFFPRFVRTPAYVLNVGGSAAVIWEQTVYSKKPIQGMNNPYSIHIGRPFVAFENVDYRFADFPHQIEAKENSRHVKTRVGLVNDVEPANLLSAMIDKVPLEDRLSFAEAHLRVNPDDTMLTQVYLATCILEKQSDQCKKFFAAQSQRRPLNIGVHRMYQGLCQMEGAGNELIAEYDRLLEREPNSSALLYLRGRIDPDRDAADEYYRRAIAADDKNAYPWYAKGYHLMMAGDFPSARAAFEKACQCRPNDLEMATRLFDARYACKEFAKLERELEPRWSSNPASIETGLDLMKVLAAEQKFAEMERVATTYQEALLARVDNPETRQLALQMKLTELYYRSSFTKLLEESAAVTDPEGAAIQAFRANFELGRLEDAEKNYSVAIESPQPFVELCLSVAWRQKGNVGKADQWLKKATEHFAAGDQVLLAGLFAKVPYVQVSDLQRIDFKGCVDKAITLTALAQLCPESRDEMLALADKLNFEPIFPHHFLKGAIERSRARSPTLP